MKKEVFISYSSQDREIAEGVVRYFESKNIECFIAPRDIVGGQAYASCLTKAIDTCEAAVLIASDVINSSDHVLNEVDILVSKKKEFIPFFIEEFEMNDEYRYYIGRKQRIIAYPEETHLYYKKLYDAIIALLPDRERCAPVQTKTPASLLQDEEALNTSTIFEYIPGRGIMINPEDRQRNVSFRTDTFINMFGGIYDNVVQMADVKKANEIFYNSGYTSGRNFAQRLSSQFDRFSQDAYSFEHKLKQWCEFDSKVGWGKFDIDIELNNETGEGRGQLKINECFLTDRTGKREICEFIKGYCSGVIETLLGVEVALTCKQCPLKNRFKTTCVLDISIDGEDLLEEE